MNTYRLLTLKCRLEGLFIAPFVAFGRLLARLYPLKREYRVFFFFPFYHTGGAEKVHVQIAAAIGGPDCIIFFTRRSQADTFREAFRHTGCELRDLSRYTDNKWIYFVNLVFRGVLSGYINRQQTTPLVFHGHSNIAYKTAPWIHPRVRQIDLVHSMNSFSHIRIPFLQYYAQTVLISRVRLEEHRAYYRRIGVPESYISRMRYIGNAVEVPEPARTPNVERPLSILFSGRNGVEKRLPLFLQIAKEVKARMPQIRFQVMGASAEEVPGDWAGVADFLGNQSDPAAIWRIYSSNDLLLLTSATEGMPLAVIEAMGSGCSIIATPVGDLPLHIQSGAQGFLCSTASDEALIREEATAWILQLNEDRALLATISLDNRSYYEEHFSMPAFRAAYRSLLTDENTSSETL